MKMVGRRGKAWDNGRENVFYTVFGHRQKTLRDLFIFQSSLGDGGHLGGQ